MNKTKITTGIEAILNSEQKCIYITPRGTALLSWQETQLACVAISLINLA